MTTLTIDELSGSLRRRWGWPASADHVPADRACPLLLPGRIGNSPATGGICGPVDRPLAPGTTDQTARIARVNGKPCPSMG